MPSKAHYASTADLAAAIRVARGDLPADLVIKRGRFLDVFAGELAAGDVAVYKGRIAGVADAYEGRETVDARGAFVVPGFIDAHVHIESSLLTPVRFQQCVLPAGTTTVVWDPHEIANVRGVEGLHWALEASEGLELDVFVMLSSCVPSTSPHMGLETSGAELTTDNLLQLRGHPRVLGLAEMMNYPGLLAGDPAVLDKLVAFAGMRRDGHCPGLVGKELNAYGAAGIHSCHESTTIAEAREKLRKGIHVLIREGSCAKDADTLLPLLDDYSSAVIGLCSDDRNPADIAREGHIGFIVDKALRAGLRPEAVFRAASFAAARAYGLEDRGAVAPGYQADLCLVRPRDSADWRSGLTIDAVYKRGRRVDESRLARAAEERTAQGYGVSFERNLHLDPVGPADFRVAAASPMTQQPVRVIGVRPGSLLTAHRQAQLRIESGEVVADPSQDVLKVAVLERHRRTGRRAVGFIQGFGLQHGAIACSINHDSHNVIVVGADSGAMSLAVNHLRDLDGGIAVVGPHGALADLRLPVGGLMTECPPADVARSLEDLKAAARGLGCRLDEPFLQLAFIALPVIPSLKITDRGLVDVERFELVSALL
ncbi:MAG: adenine deaminase [Chromatiaceae bacterium]